MVDSTMSQRAQGIFGCVPGSCDETDPVGCPKGFRQSKAGARNVEAHATPVVRFESEWADEARTLFDQVRDPDTVAEQLDLPVRTIRRFLTREGLAHLALPSGTTVRRSRRWEPDEILEVIRRSAAETDNLLTLSKFEGWAADGNVEIPSQRTVIVNFGSWAQACTAAGVESGHPSRPYERDITNETCLDAVRAYVAECETSGKKPTLTGYERVSSQRGWPCRNSVTLRLGQWRAIVEQVVFNDEDRRAS